MSETNLYKILRFGKIRIKFAFVVQRTDQNLFCDDNNIIFVRNLNSFLI